MINHATGLFRRLPHFLMMFIIIAGFTEVKSQSLEITVQDENHTALPGAVVRLLYPEDSTSINTFTNGEGLARFPELKQGIYLMEVSHLSYRPVEKALNIKEDTLMLTVQLKDRVNELGIFRVKGTRPLIRQEDDKMIIDPEPIANTSTNTLEVLESTPGLYVDQDGGIYLNSATPAVVFINGREQKMSSQDINTILRSLPPGSVERIEVLRTPSSKYDAASSGGIINIVLKKGVKIGRFGSLNGGMNQGYYGNRFAGFTLNNSGEKSTMYLNGNYSFNDNLEEINASRMLAPDTNLLQASETRHRRHQGYFGYGISFEPKERLSLNYDGRVNIHSGQTKGISINHILGKEPSSFLMQSDHQVNNFTDFFSIQQDVGMILKLDTNGSEWDHKFGYSYTGGSSDQDFITSYSFPLIYAQSGEGVTLQQRQFFLLQSDLTWKAPLKINVEAGAKSTWQEVSNDADFFTLQGSTLVDDPNRTNAYRYRERIIAGYAQASRNLWFGFLLKGGVRLEQTWMQGHQTIPVDTSFLVSRTDWFPYVYLSRKVFSMGEAELRGYLIYRKTIQRPDYQNLNPSIRIIDQFLYETGNPSLKPQFTENYEVNISFNEFPVLAIGRSYTTDIFSSVVYQDEKNSTIAIRTYDNLGKSKESYLRGMVGIPPGNKYFFALGAQYNYNHYEGFYENEPLNYKRGSWRFFTFHSLNLFKETRLTMSGFLMHKGNYYFYELGTFGALNFGLTQTFLHKKLHITLSARDVLRTMVTRFELHQGSIITSGDRYTDNQRFGINIRYNFGIKTKEEKRELFPVDDQMM